MKIPIIAAGHGASDSGAVSQHGNERDQCIEIVDEIQQILLAEKTPVIVPPHEDDTGETIAWINRYIGQNHPSNYRAFEIHRDWGNVSGDDAKYRCGVIYGDSQTSKRMGEAMHAAMMAAGAGANTYLRKHTDTRHKTGIGFIKQPRCFSFILEVGFVQAQWSADLKKKLAQIAAAAIKTAL